MYWFFIKSQEKNIDLLLKAKKTKRTCLIGIRLIDGVIWPSWSKLCRELCKALLINDWELVGALESAECGDGEPPFNGRFIVDGHACISSPELKFAGIGSVWNFLNNFSNFCQNQITKLSFFANYFEIIIIGHGYFDMRS